MPEQALQIENWDPTHPRWSELSAVIAGEGQTSWAETNAPFHCSSHMLVALCDNEIAGFLRYVRQPIGPDDCPAVTVDGEVLIEAKILAFAVVAHHRRRGIGRALQRSAIDQAEAQGCYQVRSHSSGKAIANHRLKLKLGFAVHPIVRGDDRQGAYFILPLRHERWKGNLVSYRKINGVPVWGDPQENAVEQILNCARNAEAAALMADHHLGYAVPIGGVVAYEDQISPSGVGYDIACGNKAVRLDIPAGEVKRNIATIMDDIWATLSFGIGRKNNEPVDHALFDDPAWQVPVAREHKKLASDQLGTIGSGNHYVDIFEDEQGQIWVGVHFGSRGLGHRLATHFIKAGGGKDGINVDPVLLPIHSALGEDYLACMTLAGRYAYAGRDWVAQRVADLLGARILEEVHNHHNFAWLEEHGGRRLWVVRKGATPAFPGQLSFVGGSMGDISVILEGIESPDSELALYSTVHGAGRVMSRTQAAGRSRWQSGKLVQVKEGAISRQMMMDWVEQMGVELRGAGTDESPHCYKRLPEVLNFHEGTVRIVHTLRPLGVAMAGPDIHDPYKD